MRGLLLTIFVSIPLFTFGQSSGFIIEEHINSIINQGDEVQNQHYYELLLYYFDNPIDLNKTTAEELNLIQLFTADQIEEIMQRRTSTGLFQSVYELQALNSFSAEDIRKVLPFLTANQNESITGIFKGIVNKSNNYLAMGYSRVLEEARGYREQHYLGSPDQLQLRLRIRNPGKLSIGLTAQKDPGEEWLTGNSIKVPDFVSGHLYLENQGRIKQLNIGDYRLQFGQGLVLGAGFLVGKNIETVSSIKQTTLGVLPYNSITENKFFRGAGVTIKVIDDLNLTMFYSNQYLDATNVEGEFFPTVSALRSSGLHRTISEINSKDQLNEQVWGGALTYNRGSLSTGLVIATTQFDKNIKPRDQAYSQYAFTGRQLLNYSWHGQYTIENFMFFGELAHTHNAGTGLNLGLIGNISKHLDLSILFRTFDKDYYSLYGQGFSERSTLSNEQGIYYGLKIHPARSLTISAYFDMYSFPWLTSSTAAPSSGKDFLFRIDNSFSKSSKAFIQIRNEASMVREVATVTASNTTNRLLKAIASIDYGLENKLSFRTRIQYNNLLNVAADKSWLMYQDVNYNSMKVGLTGRILFFDTNSFATRQYVYEKDMLFTYLTRGYSGKGLSYYLILKFKPIQKLSIRAKWAYTEYVNESTVGSGYDQISGNLKTQITTQIHYRF